MNATMPARTGETVSDDGTPPPGTVRADRTMLALSAPDSWTEWKCPACRNLHRWPDVVCPADGHELVAVEVSLPFIWLG